MSAKVPDGELVRRLRHGQAHGMDTESMLAGAIADGMGKKRAARLRAMLRHPVGTAACVCAECAPDNAAARWADLHAEMAEFRRKQGKPPSR